MQSFCMCMIQHTPVEEDVYLLFIEKYVKIHSIYLQVILKNLQPNFFSRDPVDACWDCEWDCINSISGKV